MGIFYWEKAFHARKKIRKNDFAPSEKYAWYAPARWLATSFLLWLHVCPYPNILLFKYHENKSKYVGAVSNFARVNILWHTSLHTHTHTHTHPTYTHTHSANFIVPFFPINNNNRAFEGIWMCHQSREFYSEVQTEKHKLKNIKQLKIHDWTVSIIHLII